MNWTASWEICMQVKNQQLELGMELTGSKSGKEYIKVVYCHPYLTYIQSISGEMSGWMKHKLESRLAGNVNNLRYADDTIIWQKAKKN